VTVRIAFTKWGGAAHWTLDGSRLGSDAHGVWIGCPAPLVVSRPGAVFRLETGAVQLIPYDQPWVLAAYPRSPALAYELYIDITTVPQWSADGRSVTMVDLDLDVVRHWDGSVEILDEDEFAAHRVELGYPAEVVELAERSCADVAAAVKAGEEPFASVYRSWLARVTG
jgi:hypothetical protein